jgi:hypothetical protein
MTQPKTRKAAQAPVEPPVDPLADLRDPEADPNVPREAEPDPEPEVAEVRPMVTQTTQDEMAAEVVVAWHADTVATGFLHKGGCGCRYLARLALRHAVPAMTAEDLAERDLEPATPES